MICHYYHIELYVCKHTIIKTEGKSFVEQLIGHVSFFSYYYDPLKFLTVCMNKKNCLESLRNII